MYGLKDLKEHIEITETSVECPVLGCAHKVARQRNRFASYDRFKCPTHGIYISSSTFEYGSDLDNILWKDQEDLVLLGNISTVKRESRMARDNSEDAVTWNGFRYLEKSGQLQCFLRTLSNNNSTSAEIIYWSYSQKKKDSWPMLNQARKEFGEAISRGSEPDVIINTDEALFFFEAKITAKNETRPSGEGRLKKYLTGGNNWFKQVFLSDFHTIAIKNARYELLRFWLLGTWMAREKKSFYLISLVRDANDKEIVDDFARFIFRNDQHHFIRVTWEELYNFVKSYAPSGNGRDIIMRYFENKCIGYNKRGDLRKAFAV